LADENWLIQAVLFDGFGQLVNGGIIQGNRAIDSLVFRGGPDIIDVAIERLGVKPCTGLRQERPGIKRKLLRFSCEVPSTSPPI
jgi:hypothetical protein